MNSSIPEDIDTEWQASSQALRSILIDDTNTASIPYGEAHLLNMSQWYKLGYQPEPQLHDINVDDNPSASLPNEELGSSEWDELEVNYGLLEANDS